MLGAPETIGHHGMARPAPAGCGSPVRGSHPRRVLVAADDHLIRARLGGVLIGAGFDVVGHAADSRQAVVAASAARPDVLVLEVGTADTDAFAIVREVTDQAIAPVVLLAAPSRSGLIEWAVGGRPMACLVTPFAPSSLLAAVDAGARAACRPRHSVRRGGRPRPPNRERNLVEQAKGALMFHQQMTEAQAHRWLQQAAMHRRVKVTRVAAGVIRRWAV